jgi:hypothetical protein
MIVEPFFHVLNVFIRNTSALENYNLEFWNNHVFKARTCKLEGFAEISLLEIKDIIRLIKLIKKDNYSEDLDEVLIILEDLVLMINKQKLELNILKNEVADYLLENISVS